jgi:hypothetical protein
MVNNGGSKSHFIPFRRIGSTWGGVPQRGLILAPLQCWILLEPWRESRMLNLLPLTSLRRIPILSLLAPVMMARGPP